MNLSNFSILEGISGSWWMLPKPIQDYLTKFTGQQEWTLLIYKNKDTTWGFDLPYLLTWNEKLMNGTEKDLDHWYEELTGNLPSDTSKMYLTVSSTPTTDPTTTLMFIGDDDLFTGSSYYLDQKSGFLIWLCPYLQFLFGSKPEKLYLKLGIKS
jgi:hypothetical protein